MNGIHHIIYNVDNRVMTCQTTKNNPDGLIRGTLVKEFP